MGVRLEVNLAQITKTSGLMKDAIEGNLNVALRDASELYRMHHLGPIVNRRSIDRQEMPQKEKAGPARPVRDRRWSDSQ